MPHLDALYRETNDVANKEAALDIKIPSIVWSRSYLLPKREGFKEEMTWDEKTPGRRLTPSELKQYIDKAIILFLRCSLGQNFTVDPSVSHRIVLFADVFHKDLIYSGRSNAAAKWSDRTPEENRLIETDERALVLRGVWEDKGRPFDLAIRIHVRTNLFTVAIVASARKASDEGYLHPHTPAHFAELTAGFWNRYASSVLRSCRLGRDFQQKAFMNVFADSRGVIISGQTYLDGNDIASVVPSETWAGPVAARLAPILSPHNHHGCMATYMLDRRAMSLTTFGVDAPSNLGSARTPLTFVMCVHPGNLASDPVGWRRQLGYVMARSHTITTMRLAALIDIRLLRRASVDLTKVDDLKRWAREQIASYEKREEEADPARRAMEELRRKFDEISNNFLRKNAAGIGLTYRIEASRYYIAEFWKHVELLKLKPIDGYQSYDQSIERNIGITFEFIDRLGSRYDRLLRERTSIEQTFSSAQSHYTSTLIAEIQRNGEFILVGALVPYYLINTLMHVVGEEGKPETIRHHLSESSWTMVQTAIWTTCAFTALYRALFSKYKATKLRKDWTHFFFKAGVLGAWLLTTSLLCLGVRWATR